jgi:hypothetical protein
VVHRRVSSAAVGLRLAGRGRISTPDISTRFIAVRKTPTYRHAFWQSRHHLWWALATLGLGFASGEPLGLVGGVTLYALGVIFIPDAGFFRRTIDLHDKSRRDGEAAAQLAAFRHREQRLLAGLSPDRQTRYDELIAVCRDIESSDAGADGLDIDTRRRKLDELLWTSLQMFCVEQSLAAFLDNERKEQVPVLIRTIAAETETLGGEVAALKLVSPRPALLEGKERLLTSRLERLETLQQRLRRIDEAEVNCELVCSEQKRLVEQVKLIRADALAARNADTLAARIDLSIEHLAATNKWLSELADFADLTAHVPAMPDAAGPRPRPNGNARNDRNCQRDN